MESTRKFSLNLDFKAEEFDGETLLYAVSTGKGVYLNETARLICNMADKGHSQEEMTALLKEAFPGQKSSISADIAAALDALLAQGVLQYADDADDIDDTEGSAAEHS